MNQLNLDNNEMDSLAKMDFPLTLRYDFDVKKLTNGLLYFNPLLGEGYKTNPFKCRTGNILLKFLIKWMIPIY